MFMSYIFISYSRHDKAYVETLAMALSRRGMNVWYDVGVEGGDSWWRKVAQKVAGCAAFVVVMSPEAENSVWVERETILAERDDKPIIPLLLDGNEFGTLANLKFYDVRDGGLPNEDAFEKLASLLPDESRHDTELLDPSVIAEALAGGESTQAGGNIPKGFLYSKHHIWIRAVSDDTATLGITDYLQSWLGIVLQIELAPLGTALRSGDDFASVDTQIDKVVLISPLEGTIVEINSPLMQQAELINTNPYGHGWLVRIQHEGWDSQPTLTSLMNAAQYAEYCKNL